MLEIDDLEINAAVQPLNKDQVSERYSENESHKNRRAEAVVKAGERDDGEWKPTSFASIDSFEPPERLPKMWIL